MTQRYEVARFRVPRKTWNRAVRYVTSAHPRFARGAAAEKRDVQPGAGAGDWSGQTPATSCARAACAAAVDARGAAAVRYRLRSSSAGGSSGVWVDRRRVPCGSSTRSSESRRIASACSSGLSLPASCSSGRSSARRLILPWSAGSLMPGTVAIPDALMPPRGIGAVNGELYPRGLEFDAPQQEGVRHLGSTASPRGTTEDGSTVQR